jgi:RNA polymerase sigma factor (sigma-70 family)
MELLARLPELREPRALPAWLMQVTHHQCYRWKRRQRCVISSDSETGIPEPETPPIAETLIRQLQEEQILREAISSLAPQCQKLVAALFFESPARPYAEIAAELGLAVGSVGFTRQKCIERLRRNLRKMGFE